MSKDNRLETVPANATLSEVAFSAPRAGKGMSVLTNEIVASMVKCGPINGVRTTLLTAGLSTRHFPSLEVAS